MPRKKNKKGSPKTCQISEKKWVGHVERDSIREVAWVQIQLTSLSEIYFSTSRFSVNFPHNRTSSSRLKIPNS